MSLIHSAKLNGLDPYAYLRDVLERLPTQSASRVEELLPHCWGPSTSHGTIRQAVTLEHRSGRAQRSASTAAE